MARPPAHEGIGFARGAVCVPFLDGGTCDPCDIDPFFLALGDPAGYTASFPDCDMNGDGLVNGGDIDPFFTCLGGGVCP